MVKFRNSLSNLSTTIPKLHHEINNENQRLQEQAVNLLETIEDIAEYFCDEHFISGEQFYVMMKALVDTKLREFPFDFEQLEEDIYE